MTLTFEYGQEDNMARYVAQLVREGLRFIQHNTGHHYEVELTGGY